MYIGLYKTPNKALSCLVLSCLVTPCSLCYPLSPLLPFVTLVTPCHPCYLLLPLLHRRTIEEFHMTLKMFSSNRGRRVRRFNTYLSPPILSWLLCTYPISHFFVYCNTSRTAPLRNNAYWSDRSGFENIHFVASLFCYIP